MSDSDQLHLSVPSKFQSLRKHQSVILARNGKKVHRSDSFFDDEFESLNAPGLADIEEDANELLPLLEVSSINRRTIVSTLKRAYHNEMYRSVLKCSLAYVIASLGVYWTAFDNLLGNTDSKHVVATVAVYFHPARSKGSMHQSIVFVVVSSLFSFFVSFTCRLMSTYFFNHGMDEMSYIIDLVVSSIGLGCIAFMKQRVNRATFNTACSLASISVVTCIVKEGSLNSSVVPFHRFVSTAQVVVIGSLISVSICYLLWPISAVHQLRKSLNDSYNIMSGCLSIVVNRFLKGEALTSKDKEAFALLKTNVKLLKSNLEEAKYELNLKGKEHELQVFEELVRATIALANHLLALRSSLEMQNVLLHEELLSSSFASEVSTIHSFRLSALVENMDDISKNADATALNSAQLFDLFVTYLAPSIKSFIFTIKDVLKEVPFEESFESGKFVKLANFQTSLHSAIDLFQAKQVESFDKLYSQQIFQSLDFQLNADKEEVTACCGNFSSLLVLYGKELINFLKIAESHEAAKNAPRSWGWLFFRSHTTAPLGPHDRVVSTINHALLNLQGLHRPPQRKKLELYTFKLWKNLKLFRRTDVQFGIRVGLGALFISTFAFYPKTKQTFNNWRGEWALVIYCIMMNKSLGGTTMTVKWRFIGTFIGAFTAYMVWLLTDGNVYALCLTGFLLCIPSFYIIIYWKKNNPFGRFILLTYNLTALYSYSMIQKDAEDDNEGGENPIVWEIAFHRFIAVSLGIIWALLMASVFIPNSARARLKTALTILWLRMGVIWNGDPLKYEEQGPQTRLIGLRDEHGIHDLLAECEVLLKQAPLEFRLKGGFPRATYANIIARTSTILDAFQNMNLMVEVDPVLAPNEKYVIDYIAAERNELEHRIFLIFYMIASALKLGIPLPSKPASTEHAKDRLLNKLNEIRSKSNEQVKLTNEDYVLLYSYILVTSTITRELDEIIGLIKDLLGDISEEVFQLV